MRSIKIEYTERTLKDLTSCTLFISQPITRPHPATVARIRARFGVPPDAPETLMDKGLFKNIQIVWPERPWQIRLPFSTHIPNEKKRDMLTQ